MSQPLATASFLNPNAPPVDTNRRVSRVARMNRPESLGGGVLYGLHAEQSTGRDEAADA